MFPTVSVRQAEAANVGQFAIVVQIAVAKTECVVRSKLIVDSRADGRSPLGRWIVVLIGLRAEEIRGWNRRGDNAVVVDIAPFEIDKETGVLRDRTADIAAKQLCPEWRVLPTGTDCASSKFRR